MADENLPKDYATMDGLKYENEISLNTDKKIFHKDYKVRNLDDVWKGQVNQDWAQLKYLKHSNPNHTDTATLLQQLDPNLDIIVFEINRQTHKVFIYQHYTGRWLEQKGTAFLEHKIEIIRDKIDKLVIKPIKKLYKSMVDMIQGGDMDEVMAKQYNEVCNKIKWLEVLLHQLGEYNWRNNVVKVLYSKAVSCTIQNEYTIDMFDSKKGYIGFNDGIYSIDEKKLLTGNNARELFITQSVGYNYSEVEALDDPENEEGKKCYEAFITFINQIIPDEDLRYYIFKRFNNSLRRVMEKLILIFYNRTGDNGKTMLMKLIGMTFGNYYVKSNNNLIKKTRTSSSSANESLAGLNKKLLTYFAEPDGTLNMSVLKELIGGEEISTRGIFEKQSSFFSQALIIIATNDIPPPDSKTTADFKKLKCVPFEAEFVDTQEKVNVERHKYLKDTNIDSNFEAWRYCCMKYILSYTKMKDKETPKKVLDQSQEYSEKQNIFLRYFNDRVDAVDEGILLLADLYEDFVCWGQKDGMSKYEIGKKMDFKDDIMPFFPLGSYRKDTEIKDDVGNVKRVKNFWYGYTLKSDYMIKEDPADNYD